MSSSRLQARPRRACTREDDLRCPECHHAREERFTGKRTALIFVFLFSRRHQAVRASRAILRGVDMTSLSLLRVLIRPPGTIRTVWGPCLIVQRIPKTKVVGGCDCHWAVRVQSIEY